MSESESTENPLLLPKPSNHVKRQLKKNKLTLEEKAAKARDVASRLKKKVRDVKQVDDVLKGSSAILDADALETTTNSVEREIRKRKQLWIPQVNPDTGRSVQLEFLEASEKEVLSSGGRGSGKSSALLIDPLRYITNGNFRGLVIRRTMPDLRELIRRARDLYVKLVPGVKWREQEKLFVFPSGALLEFGYLDHDDDVSRYQGQEYTWLGIDEVSQFPSESVYEMLLLSIRTADPTLKTYVRLTTNPFGPGFHWVKKRFVDQGPEATKIEVKSYIGTKEFISTRRWLQSNIYDNPALMDANPTYLAQLASLPEAQRKRFLEGSWDGMDGAAFPEFSRALHVIKPFPIPQHWTKFRACDWGYSTMAVCLWMAVDEEDNIYVYRELTTGAKTPRGAVEAPDFGRMVLRLEASDAIRYGVIDGSIGDKRGSMYPTIDEQMRDVGCYWTYADKSDGSRIAGKNLMHQRLRIDPVTNKPKIFFFDTCTEIIEEMSSLPLDVNRPEDIDTKVKDHAWDAIRYGLLSRPRAYDSFLDDAPEAMPIIINPAFGY